ncbi:uncharacterized protein PHALS_02539 [Plasmopara halstedii]|uniref:Uncharacterized protein n=1 Tax=Plasmopara halstedii TaxID=4781 RepID=A0A0P1AWK4_PLAHL|nr:uncharacterized protein PHALS_02539 [Plasmopara halstedii]CEG46117.1 hypothetical protein PHALS_02539 [Plasmopara halstedii]|eukprot:XP_024582486.1 hypothetical protein PHALS_02539 [Plasmopara halstedii]
MKACSHYRRIGHSAVQSQHPEQSNEIADTLSRNRTVVCKVGQFSLQGLLYAVARHEILAAIEVLPIFIEEIPKKLYKSDQTVGDSLAKLTKDVMVPRHTPDDGFLYYLTFENEKPRLVIPENEHLKKFAIQTHN